MRALLPPFIAFLIRCLARLVRLEFEDCCGFTQGKVDYPVIWAFWHNRILMVPMAKELKTPDRRGTVLTSPSRDGAMLAAVMAQFKVDSARGSSSRRGGQALRELISAIKSGRDAVITPDGPRGPVYKLGPGIIKLALLTGTPILPIYVHYTRFWQTKSWDGFRIPKPFSRVKIVFGALLVVSPQAGEGADASHDGEAFEAERARIETALISGNEECGRECQPQSSLCPPC